MCPPGVDQTTRTSPQWNIIAPEVEQTRKLPQKQPGRDRSWMMGAAPHRFIKSCLSWGAFEKLAQVAPCDDKTQIPLLPTSLVLPAANISLSVLESLPTELLRMITLHLEVPDKVALGLCSQWLWCHVLKELQMTCSTSVAPWAGRMILCTSTWLTDLPPTIHAAYPEIREKTKKRLADIRAGWGWRAGMEPSRAWNWDTYRFTNVEGNYIEQQYLVALEEHVGEVRLPEKFHDVLKLKIKEMSRYLRRGPQGSNWVLRNFNTREVVHFERIKGGVGGVNGEDMQVAVREFPWLTLDVALVMRISWASDMMTRPEPSSEDEADLASRRLSDPLRYGVWAGHRFDLVEAKSFNSQEKEWTDVTAEVVREAKAIKLTLPMDSHHDDDSDSDSDS